MENNQKNTVNKAVSWVKNQSDISDTNNDSTNYMEHKPKEVVIGSCGKLCEQCKIGDCLTPMIV